MLADRQHPVAGAIERVAPVARADLLQALLGNPHGGNLGIEVAQREFRHAHVLAKDGDDVFDETIVPCDAHPRQAQALLKHAIRVRGQAAGDSPANVEPVRDGDRVRHGNLAIEDWPHDGEIAPVRPPAIRIVRDEDIPRRKTVGVLLVQ